jgi:hypothetical protein
VSIHPRRIKNAKKYLQKNCSDKIKSRRRAKNISRRKGDKKETRGEDGVHGRTPLRRLFNHVHPAS